MSSQEVLLNVPMLIDFDFFEDRVGVGHLSKWPGTP